MRPFDVDYAGDRQPPIDDYALLSDGRGAALVSSAGSIDWCCLPRMDHGSCFGRLLDGRRGGHCSIAGADGPLEVRQAYLPGTLVVETTLRCAGGEARLLDLLVVTEEAAHGMLLRVLDGVRGRVDVEVEVVPRFDYGSVRPWLRRPGACVVYAVGGDDALVVGADTPLRTAGEHDVVTTMSVEPGRRCRLALRSVPPADTEHPPQLPGAEELDALLDGTVAWWRAWRDRCRYDGPHRDAVVRSALVLRGLVDDRTGAVAAAATTSLPEAAGGVRNWDYRFSWVRDSAFTVRSLAELGYDGEADAFARFALRSAAGAAEEVQVLFGLGGERRIAERELDVAGYRGASPARVGNAAAGQLQLGVLGQLVGLAWRRHRRGTALDDDQWRFVAGLVETAAGRWQEPDRSIWEWRGDPKHFTYSKAACWSALQRGLDLAASAGRDAPAERWEQARDAVRAAVLDRGVHPDHGGFTQAFESTAMDAAVLLLPETGFVAWDDERMVATVDAVVEALGEDGLLRRYAEDDGLPGREGAFLACSFWLVECLARQGRRAEAERAFARAAGTASPLGLFSEEYDPRSGTALGNTPQALTHLAHIGAALALDGRPPEPGG